MEIVVFGRNGLRARNILVLDLKFLEHTLMQLKKGSRSLAFHGSAFNAEQDSKPEQASEPRRSCGGNGEVNFSLDFLNPLQCSCLPIPPTSPLDPDLRDSAGDSICPTVTKIELITCALALTHKDTKEVTLKRRRAPGALTPIDYGNDLRLFENWRLIRQRPTQRLVLRTL